jgi:DNA-binding Lrp family transcriptional regulator
MWAVIEIGCAAVRLHSVAAAIADDPHVVAVSHVTGSHDLVVMAAFADQISLGRFLRFRIGGLDGVQSLYVHVVTSLHAVACRWRLDRLSAPRHAALLADTPTGLKRPACGIGPDAADLALMNALSANPRQSVADLARDTDLSPTSVRRHLTRIDAAKFIVCHLDVARCASGWPIAVHFWGTMPPDHATRITTQITHLRETRFCGTLTGRNNLMFTVWLHSTNALEPFETLLARQIPELVITARNLVLWNMKFGTNILNPEGRRIRTVPFSLWPDQEAVAAEHKLLNDMRASSS